MAHQPGEQTRWADAFGKGKTFCSASVNFIEFAWRFVAETGACHELRFAQQLASGAVLDFYLLGLTDQDDKKPLTTVRNLFHWYEAHRDDYEGLRSAARVGLYHSRKNTVFGKAVASGQYIQACSRGTYRALLDARIPFHFVIDEQAGDEDFAETLSRYDAIVLPNVACLDEGEAAAFDAVVAAGGTLIATGETGRYDANGNRRDSLALNCLPTASICVAVEPPTGKPT